MRSLNERRVENEFQRTMKSKVVVVVVAFFNPKNVR